jgi:hypothetical protein
MFLRVLSAMVAADAIDRHLRAQQQRRLADELARYREAFAPPQGTPRHKGDLRGAAGRRCGLEAPERPT